MLDIGTACRSIPNSVATRWPFQESGRRLISNGFSTPRLILLLSDHSIADCLAVDNRFAFGDEKSCPLRASHRLRAIRCHLGWPPMTAVQAGQRVAGRWRHIAGAWSATRKLGVLTESGENQALTGGYRISACSRMTSNPETRAVTTLMG